MDKVMSFYTRVFTLMSVILSPIIYFLIWLRRGEGKNILVIPQFKRIGDIVCSTPVFKAIKEKYPDSHITVIVSTMAVGILKNNPRIDGIIIIEDYWHNFPGLVKRIRKDNFQWGFSLSGSALSSTLLFLGLIPNRIKTVRNKRPLMESLTDWLNTKQYRFLDGEFLPDHHLKLLHEIKIEKPEGIKEIFLNEKAQGKIDSFLKQNNIIQTDKLVGVSITAGNKIKEWGDEKFREVGEYLIEKKGVKVLYLGTSGDSQRIQNIINKSNVAGMYEATIFSIEELPSLMKRMSLYIASDTGPIYIAHALGIPLIDIIGPVDPREQPPQDARSIQVRPAPEFKPTSFVFKEAEDREMAKKAIESIKVEDVIRAVNILLPEN